MKSSALNKRVPVSDTELEVTTPSLLEIQKSQGLTNNAYLMKVFALVGFLLSLHLVLIWQFYYPKNDLLWGYHTFLKKDQIAQSFTSNKVVIAGGSSTLFGFRCKDLQTHFGIPFVNYGTNAQFGWDYILYRVKETLKAGDTIILVPELHLLSFHKNQMPDLYRVNYLFAFDRKFWKENTTFYEKIQGIIQISPFALAKSAFLNILRPHQAEQSLSDPYYDPLIYNSNTLNENGDETNNKGIIFKENSLAFSPPPVLEETDSFRLIKEFKTWCDNHNITLMITFPNILDHPDLHSTKHENYYEWMLSYYKKLDMPILGRPQDFFYQPELIYDTFYHLNQEGMTIRTQQMIELLSPVLKQKRPG